MFSHIRSGHSHTDYPPLLCQTDVFPFTFRRLGIARSYPAIAFRNIRILYLPSAESCQPFLHLPLGRTVTTTLKCHGNISPALTHPTTDRSSHANLIRMVTAPRQLELTGCKLGKVNCVYRSPRSVLPTSPLTFSLIFV